MCGLGKESPGKVKQKRGKRTVLSPQERGGELLESASGPTSGAGGFVRKVQTGPKGGEKRRVTKGSRGKKARGSIGNGCKKGLKNKKKGTNKTGHGCQGGARKVKSRGACTARPSNKCAKTNAVREGSHFVGKGKEEIPRTYRKIDSF